MIEMLVVVALLGLAGALVIPSMSSVGVLRVQAALQTTVADLMFAQSDAIAFQQRRAVVFDVPATAADIAVENKNSYRVIQVLGGQIDAATGTLYDPARPGGRMIQDLSDEKFGGAKIQYANFDGVSTLIFDELGAPAAAATGDAPGRGGTIRLGTADQTFDIVVEPFTGRITVRKIAQVAVEPVPPVTGN